MAAVSAQEIPLGSFARAGFDHLSEARTRLSELSVASRTDPSTLLAASALAANPDEALALTLRIAQDHPDRFAHWEFEHWERWWRLVGASPVLGDFLDRNPSALARVIVKPGRIPDPAEARAELLAAVSGPDGVLVGDVGWNALRVAYRTLLTELMMWDLQESQAGRATEVLEDVAAGLTVLAEGVFAAALQVAHATLETNSTGPASTPQQGAALRLAVIGMGKCGAEELNVVSDVDVMFVVESADPEVLDGEGLIRAGTAVARELMRVIHDPALEPPLWEVDPNLRPEGRQGPLVRTLGSMQAYYERWAHAWEFQALMKARTIAGDVDLGEAFVNMTRPMVWASGGRSDFVGSVHRMRERVTEHISLDEMDCQLKLGPGGLRDVEFSVQLLQLVHGQYDDRIHAAGTLPALRALVADGYVARSDGDQLAEAYRGIRVLEHRLQLRELRRTALMPTDDAALRHLARASGLAVTAAQLLERWEQMKRDVRRLHLKIFYAPLLSAVAELPEEEFVLGSDAARARLSSIGFRDPDGAFRHLAALTRGTSRRAKIQRNLMPVLLQWLADGTDPDFGLLAFRKVSEANAETPWYLRLLRDGYEAAERLTKLLSSSKFTADLLESSPEAVAWLERDEQLQPTMLDQLRAEMRAFASRQSSLADVAAAIRRVHRREILRLAMGYVVGVLTDAEVSLGLDAAHTALLDGLLLAARTITDIPDTVELSLIAMGRYGGGELGFASDIDLIAVYRAPAEMSGDHAQRAAIRLVSELRTLVADPRFPVDLDFDLRPEGKNGPLARSLAAYEAYYSRWSVVWEAQALLRARPVAGDAQLGQDFVALADRVRYPENFSAEQTREVRRVKARVESERLPQGADPKLHLKLGPGGISDVEWLVQLLQLQHGAQFPALQTVSTLDALTAAAEHEFLTAMDAERLRESWEYASTVRSALKLWSGRGSDSMPTDWQDLAGLAGVLGHPANNTSELVERWRAVSRRARAVFDREFFGYDDDLSFSLLR